MSFKKHDAIIINNKLWTKELVKALLERNDKAVIKGMERIMSFQTYEEKRDKFAAEKNGKGFSKYHTRIMTNLYNFYKEKGFLTKKQMETARNVMLKYSGQLFEYMKGTL